MILQALHDLAMSDDLIGDPDFEPKPIRWVIHIGKGGKFLGFQDTSHVPSEEEGKKSKKKPKPVPAVFEVPLDAGLNSRTSGVYAGPLFDKAGYVFGHTVNEKDRTAKNLARAEKQREAFRERACAILDATQDEGVAAVVAFLDAVAAGEIPALPEDCGPGDLFGFIHAPDIDMLVTSRDSVRDWWKRERTRPVDDGPKMQCLVTGKAFADPDLFPKIKRVPGVQGDISLVSYNAGAFESFGLESNENAPVCREAAEAIATALNRLLHPAWPVPERDPPTLPARSLRIADDTAFCYWSKGDGAFENMLQPLFDADPSEVKEEVWNRLWSGIPPAESGVDLTPFYGLVITGQTGRAILRDWFETTLDKAQRSVARHFRDLKIVRNAPWKKNESPPPAIGMRTLLESIAEQGDRRNIPSALAGEFVRAAMTGCLYPFGLLTRAVQRSRAEIGNDDWTALQRRDARAALIKAIYNRMYSSSNANGGESRREPPPEFREVLENMDPQNRNPGYVLGCLMAVLERLQQEAIEDVNASVVDKYFSGASAAPKATFDRLLKNARHHARKAEGGKNPWFVSRLERLIDELIVRINVRVERGQPVGFPLTLPLEQQGLFVIGYHHMRHWLWMNREEREVWENDHDKDGDLPRAMIWSSRDESAKATVTTT